MSVYFGEKWTVALSNSVGLVKRQQYMTIERGRRFLPETIHLYHVL
jgi:hypothetical protein